VLLFVEQAKTGCIVLCFDRNLAILPLSVKHRMMSTSDSFSKAMEHDVLVRTSMLEAYLPISLRSSRLLMWACSKSKMASASAMPLARQMVACILFLLTEVS